MTVRVSSPQQVAYGGEVLGESVIESEEQIGSEVIHTYDVSCITRPTVLHSDM